MSQENVEIVRNVYAALNRGDWNAGFCDAHENFEARSRPPARAGIGSQLGGSKRLVVDDSRRRHCVGEILPEPGRALEAAGLSEQDAHSDS